MGPGDDGDHVGDRLVLMLLLLLLLLFLVVVQLFMSCALVVLFCQRAHAV